ncbi:hypothetical protein KDL01_11440 [Actinospica durhamensis]|uniref:Uncharacterized protein n=1 Tax=Actinospica durhamensis TaxID=1508375 RepID=A0A941EU27_9ACTN|nr:hypothetical protein [Actinospica durhamensis]MBR7833884.1 hypothetical protein [Actinospica durhamensis]
MAATATDHLRAWVMAVLVAGAAFGAMLFVGPGTTAESPAPPRNPAAAYLAIAQAGNKRLDKDFDRLRGPDRTDLPAARSDLRDIAATEHLFDERLSALTLPPGPEVSAGTVISANEARAALTGQAADSTTPAQLAAYQLRLAAANAPVEHAVRDIRVQLHLPAPDTS